LNLCDLEHLAIEFYTISDVVRRSDLPHPSLKVRDVGFRSAEQLGDDISWDRRILFQRGTGAMPVP